MLMRSSLPFLALFVFYLFFSCKKETAVQINYNYTYQKTGSSVAEPIRVFANTGEIRDFKVVKRFTLQDSADFASTSYYWGVDNWMMNCRFLNAQQGVLTNYSQPETCTTTMVNGYLRLNGSNTFTGNSYGVDFTHSFIYNIIQMKPIVFNQYLISSTNGNYQFEYTGLQTYVFTQWQQQLVAPWFIFALHSNYRYYSSYFNNMVDYNFFKQIPAGDTLVLQEYYILYK